MFAPDRHQDLMKLFDDIENSNDIGRCCLYLSNAMTYMQKNQMTRVEINVYLSLSKKAINKVLNIQLCNLGL